jgi:hypothetical protein
MKYGQNSITLSPLAVDVARWSGSADPELAGDLSLNTTSGRPQFFVDGRIRAAAMTDDGGPMKVYGFYNQPRSTGLTFIGGLPAPTERASGGSGRTDLPGGDFKTYLSSASLNDDAGVISNTFGLFLISYYISFETFIYLPQLPNERVWVGLVSQDPMGSSAPIGPNLQMAAFRYDTSAGDTTWKCVLRRNTSVQEVDTLITVQTGVWYMRISWDNFIPPKAIFSIARAIPGSPWVIPSTFVVSLSATFDQPLGYCIMLRTLEAVSKSFGVASMMVTEGLRVR